MATAIFPLIAVAAMHEQVKEWAGQEEQEWEHAKQMGSMLGDQEEPGDRQEGDADPHGARSRGSLHEATSSFLRFDNLRIDLLDTVTPE